MLLGMRAAVLGVVACLGLLGCAPTLDFTLPDLDGNEVRPHTEDSVVVLAFWATWCRPCRTELAEMNEMYQRLHPRGLGLYAISVDGPETRDDVESWVQSNHYAFPVLVDDGARLFGRYNPMGTIPYLVIYDASGERIDTRRGYTPCAVAQLEKFLDQRLPSPRSPHVPRCRD